MRQINKIILIGSLFFFVGFSVGVTLCYWQLVSTMENVLIKFSDVELSREFANQMVRFGLNQMGITNGLPTINMW